MNWTERQIHFIVQDLIEENPLACSALFKLSAINFTDKVDTMAVSIAASPVLKINLDFCRQYLLNETDVKAVLLHEFLHVLLLHTEKYKCNSPLLNICLDAIINAIIYRIQGLEYAGFFARFYKWEKLSFLLRPQNGESSLEPEWMAVHKRIYEGKYGADDLYELLNHLRSKMDSSMYSDVVLLGNHTKEQGVVSDEVSEILEGIMQKMNGVKIWNKSNLFSHGSKVDKESLEIEKYSQHQWDSSVIAVLKKCLLPVKKKKPVLMSGQISSPVLTGSDKRSLSKFIWSGLLPFSITESSQMQLCPEEKVHIYLDVSGSMENEINRLVNVLFHFKRFIKRPLWVFSDEVKEAFFINERLEYDTSYGTCIEPVFEHIRLNKIRKALIVTDGYVDAINDEMLQGLNRSAIQVLLSADGNPTQFENNNIPYTRLDTLNN